MVGNARNDLPRVVFLALNPGGSSVGGRQATVPLIGAARGQTAWMNLDRPAALPNSAS